MDIIKKLLKELDQEVAITRNFLALAPADKLDWAPHEKSMKMGALAIHIAELPSWISMAINLDALDFSTLDWTPKQVNGAEDLLNIMEESYKEGKTDLEKADANKFDEPWVLRTGETIHGTFTRYEMIRVAYSQITHHRAQLGVYFRLLGIPVPISYGPTADYAAF